MKYLIVFLFWGVSLSLSGQNKSLSDQWVVSIPPDSISTYFASQTDLPHLGEKFVFRKRFKSFYHQDGKPPFVLKPFKSKKYTFSLESYSPEEFERYTGLSLQQAWEKNDGQVQVIWIEATHKGKTWRGAFFGLTNDCLLHVHQGLVLYLVRKGK